MKKILMVGTVLVLLSIGFIVLLTFSTQGVRDVFPYDTYVEHPRHLLGNRYELKAQIDTQVAWEENKGALLIVKVAEDRLKRLAVFVPAGIALNVHVGQRYRMEVRVRDGGLIYVDELEKY